METEGEEKAGGLEDIRKHYKPELVEKFLRKLVRKRGKLHGKDLAYMHRMPPEIKAKIAISPFAKMLLDAYALDALLNPDDPLTLSQWRAISYLASIHKSKKPKAAKRGLPASPGIMSGIPHIDVTAEEPGVSDVKQ